MSITFPLSLPSSPNPRSIKLSATNLVGVNVSPFTAEAETQEWPGEYWQASVTLPPIGNQVVAGQWEALLLAVRGGSGTFLLGDPSRTAPTGIATGTPKVNGSNAAGSKTLSTKGWTHSVTGILKRGDLFQVGTGTSQRLYKVVTDANSDGSGNSTLDIFPRLREALTDNTSLVLASPKGVFRLANNQRSWDIDTAFIYSFTFECVEAL